MRRRAPTSSAASVYVERVGAGDRRAVRGVRQAAVRTAAHPLVGDTTSVSRRAQVPTSREHDAALHEGPADRRLDDASRRPGRRRLLDERRRVGGGRRGARRVRGGDLDAEPVPDVGRDEGVGRAGRAGDGGAVRPVRQAAVGPAAHPLVAEGERCPTPCTRRRRERRSLEGRTRHDGVARAHRRRDPGDDGRRCRLRARRPLAVRRRLEHAQGAADVVGCGDVGRPGLAVDRHAAAAGCVATLPREREADGRRPCPRARNGGQRLVDDRDPRDGRRRRVGRHRGRACVRSRAEQRPRRSPQRRARRSTGTSSDVRAPTRTGRFSSDMVDSSWLRLSPLTSTHAGPRANRYETTLGAARHDLQLRVPGRVAGSGGSPAPRRRLARVPGSRRRREVRMEHVLDRGDPMVPPREPPPSGTRPDRADVASRPAKPASGLGGRQPNDGGSLMPGSRRRREVRMERVLGTPALFATAYGNVGSSIYYALGLTAVFALGLTPLVFVIAGIVFAATAATYAEGTVRYPGGRRLVELRAARASTSSSRSARPGRRCSSTSSRSRRRRSSSRTTSRSSGSRSGRTRGTSSAGRS